MVVTHGRVVAVMDTPPPPPLTSVPEPTSVLGLLAIGAFGGGAWLKRRGEQKA